MRFGLLGATGYVAPKHMAAMRAIGGELVLACGIDDAAGALDGYFPTAEFVTDPELFFERAAEMGLDAVAICVPNYLHVPYGVRVLDLGIDAIIEKPLAVSCRLISGNPRRLIEAAARSGAQVYPVVQLRHHPAVQAMKASSRPVSKVEVVYHVRRGPWYDASWKADDRKSGGLLVNIGIHVFDLLRHLFGELRDVLDAHVGRVHASGILELQNAIVTWEIRRDAPPRRSFLIDGQELDLTTAITALHEEVYRGYAAGRAWHLIGVMRSIEMVDAIKECAGWTPSS